MKAQLLLIAKAAMLLCGLCGTPSLSTPTAGSVEQADSEGEDILMMFWNLENFFDYIDGGSGESDSEFSAHGTRHWGRKKFQAKCSAIAKTLMWAGGREGRMPDIFAVAEVENRFVLRQLTEGTIIRKYGYSIVHYDSPDPRGIDVALLYRSQALELLESRPVRVHGTSPSAHPSQSESVPGRPAAGVQSQLVTRDILLTKFRVAAAAAQTGQQGDTIAVLVNHHPSKYGGGDTDWRRDAALARLKALKDSLVLSGVSKVVATGDFNDTPENTHFRADTLAPFINLASPLSACGEGTIRFDGRWDLIDMFMITPALLPPAALSSGQSVPPAGSPSTAGPPVAVSPSAVPPAGSPSTAGPPAGRTPALSAGEMEILHPPFLTVRDNVHPGDKPLRTYSGPRYLGGVSDHRPVILRLHRTTGF